MSKRENAKYIHLSRFQSTAKDRRLVNRDTHTRPKKMRKKNKHLKMQTKQSSYAVSNGGVYSHATPYEVSRIAQKYNED